MSGHDKTGGPAFPYVAPDAGHYSDGMSLQDHFAGLALQGLIAANNSEYMARELRRAADKVKLTPENAIAKLAYIYADAMLKARQK